MEVAAGVIAAEQIVSTTIEGSIAAGYAIGRRTLPLKAQLTQFGTVPKDGTSDSLARYSHTLSESGGDLLIFSGLVSDAKLAGNEMHIFKMSNAGGSGAEYKVVPALARDGEEVPSARFGHTACTIADKIVMFGGCSDVENKRPVDEKGRVWVFDPSSLQWNHLDATSERYPERYNHSAVHQGERLIVHGGHTNDSQLLHTDTWLFDLDSRAWKELPNMEGAKSELHASPNMAIANDKLYVIMGSTSLDSEVRVLDLSSNATDSTWTRIVFPTNPLTPGPRPRKGASLLPITTGMGRTYLLLVLGEKDDPCSNDDKRDQQQFWSGLWALQLPSASHTPASLKDATRERMGIDTGEAQWAEVKIDPQEESGSGGKSHPGPRGYFGCTALGGRKVALWGGINAASEVEGDGWIIDINTA